MSWINIIQNFFKELRIGPTAVRLSKICIIGYITIQFPNIWADASAWIVSTNSAGELVEANGITGLMIYIVATIAIGCVNEGRQ